MATSPKTIDFLLEQMAEAGKMTSRKMFGEYALYCDTKVVAFVCDDELFIKPTEAAREFIGEVIEKPAYPGSKMYFWISGEQWDDSEWLSDLIRASAASLPLPKPKKAKVK